MPSSLHLTPLLGQALVGYCHFRAQLLSEQRYPVLLEHPAIQHQLGVTLALLAVLGGARLVLLPGGRQLAGPDAVALPSEPLPPSELFPFPPSPPFPPLAA